MESESMSELTDGDSTVVLDEVKLHQIVAEGSLHFDEWTSLISEIEKTCPDNIEKICSVYDSFLSTFPLCYGYWRKYADHKMRLCTVEKVVEVFERSVLSITYCVDMWVDYCNFGRLVFEDQSDVRRLFKRAISFVGKDYLCHTLWDRYIEFEFSLKNWSSLAHIYIQALKFPTKKLRRYYDNFKKLVEIWEGAMKSHSNSTITVPAEPMLNNGTSICYSEDDLSCIIKDLLDPSSGLDRLKALNKYRSLGEGIFQGAVQLYEKVNFYETRIKRSYFHVKPLDISQLQNWHDYLDFAESHGDFNWAVQLYERCLIPCANYPEFWMRYVEFMERKGGREIASFALDRATQIHLKRLSVIHLFNARYKEHIGDMFTARAAFLQCSMASDKDFVESIVMRANMEKRLGYSEAASTIYRDALETAKAKEKWHILPALYIQFSRLKYNITNCEDAAVDILMDGIKHLPCCKLLIEELIKFAIMHQGSRHINAIDSIVADAISPQPGGSQGLSSEDGEEISRLYLEFVDLCGTLCDVRKAWNRHIRMFTLSVRDALFPPATRGRQWKMAVEAREETLVSLPNQPPGDCNSDCLVESSLPHEKLLSSENNDTHQVAYPATDEVLDQNASLLANHDLLSAQLSDQESPLVGNLVELPEKAKTDLLQSGESDNSHEDVYRAALKVSDRVEEDIIGPKLSPDLEHQTVYETENTKASLQFKKENDGQTDYNYKLEQDLKIPSLETLSLDTRDVKFAVQMSSPPHDSEAPEKTSFPDGNLLKSEASQKNNISNENILECGLNTNAYDSVSSPVCAQPSVSAQPNIRSDCRSSSANTQNITGQPLPRPPKQASGNDWHRRNNNDRFRRDSKFEFRGHSHKRQHKQRQYSPQRTRHRQGAQVQSSYPPSNIHTSEVASQDWSTHSSQHNLSTAYQSQQPTQPAVYQQLQIPQYSLQSNEAQGNAQNQQACNEAWQYYYYQQQLQLWQQQQVLQQQQQQQQQPQDEQVLQHQYQQQLLQMQYFQQQQQQGQQPQIPCQQQQLQPQEGQHYQLQQQQELLQQQQLYLQQQQQLQLQPQYQQLQLQLQQQYHQQQTASSQHYPHGQEHEHSKQQTDTSQIQDGDTPSCNSGEPRRTESTSPHPVSPSP